MSRIARVILLLGSSSPLLAQSSPIVFQNVRVFDGVRTMPSATVVVSEGRIASIGKSASPGPDAHVIDGKDKTLLPGFIDAHTHTLSESAPQQAPIFGVTTDLDMFTMPELAAGLKKQKAEGKNRDYADELSAGYLATSPGGHGTEYGIKTPTLERPDEAQAWVDARIAEGSDYIKIVYDDSREYGSPTPRPTLSKETMKAVIDAAHKRGKIAVVHIGSLRQAEDAINAGADGLAHLFIGESSEPGFGKLAASHHIFVVPTLSVLHSICSSKFNADLADDPQLRPYLLTSEVASLKRSFAMPRKLSCDGAMEAIRQLKAAGVPILTGSDAGNPGTAQGITIHGELELLVKAGLTPVEAMRAATSAPAAAFRLKDRGRIAEGMRADLVLVDGDPTTNIKATRAIGGVWEAGYPIDRAAWRAKVQEETSQVTSLKNTPAPNGAESGLISDFEEDGSKPRAKFGFGWMQTLDVMAGGKSKGEFEVVPEGATGSKGALKISGEVVQGFAFPWSGIMFLPGDQPMAPANLSGKSGISFKTKGDSGIYELMLFTKAGGFQPAIQTFAAGPDWKDVMVPFSAFGSDGHDVMAIAWCAGPNTRKFSFEIDDVKLQ